jgi:hypothetical protein
MHSAEVVVALLNGKPIAVERCSFSILTFRKNGQLVSPLSDRLANPVTRLCHLYQARFRTGVVHS